MTNSAESDADVHLLGTSIRSAGQFARDRFRSFRLIYIAVFIFLMLYISTIRITEYLLDRHFETIADEAVNITNLELPIATQIQQAMETSVTRSAWVRWGGIEVTSLVLGNDGISWIYVQGQIEPQKDGLPPTDVLRQAVELLPATATVTVTVPHNSVLANAILVIYTTVLLWGLYQHNRSNQRRYTRQLSEALEVRDHAAQRAVEIEHELETTRSRLSEMEPGERSLTREIAALQHERGELQRKLSGLAAREEELRGKANEAIDLTQEVQALEDLLEEAGEDIASKEEEIRTLEKNLKSASKLGSSKAKGKGSDLLARRLRTLYKNLEIDDHAIDNMIALRDEGMKLKAEEGLKRLGEEADNVAVRRKVGGLPGYLHIFELGFAGKGRIYYTRGKQRRFRVLAIGAKNSQDTDMDYLRRLSRDEMA